MDFDSLRLPPAARQQGTIPSYQRSSRRPFICCCLPRKVYYSEQALSFSNHVSIAPLQSSPTSSPLLQHGQSSILFGHAKWNREMVWFQKGLWVYCPRRWLGRCLCPPVLDSCRWFPFPCGEFCFCSKLYNLPLLVDDVSHFCRLSVSLLSLLLSCWIFLFSFSTICRVSPLSALTFNFRTEKL